MINKHLIKKNYIIAELILINVLSCFTGPLKLCALGSCLSLPIKDWVMLEFAILCIKLWIVG